MLRALSGVALAVAMSGCLGAPEVGESEGATLALEWEADPDAVRLVGLFAFPANLQGMSCDPYKRGEFDPFVSGEPAGITFFAVQALVEGEQVLDGITTGNRFILVEGYDAGGSRIFLGCEGPIVIEPNERKEISIEVVEDPSTL